MDETDQQRRVLLIEDDLGERRAFERTLRHEGYEVTACATADEALAQIDRHTHHCVVSDLSMPTMDGLELLQVIRVRDRDLPVVIVTGVPSIETAARAVEYGALRYLLKPVATDDLLEAVDRGCVTYRLARAQREMMALLGTSVGERDRVNLRAGFDRAIEGMWMAFQPIVRASDGSVYGYEALLRSEEPSLPHPGAVLHAAERLGEVHRLGRRVRQLAVEAMEGADPSWRLFLNLHPEDLLDGALFEESAPHMQLAHRLVLEVTERATLDRVVNVTSRIDSLRHAGVRIAVDDLGAGYAGLASFVQLNPDLVKLDMSLVRDIDSQPVKRRLVRSMTDLCKDMNLLVVAEGVETPAERDAVIEAGCHLLQGYLFARPARPFVAPA